MNVKFCLLYDIKITLKSNLWCEKIKDFVIMYTTSLWMHNVNKYVNL